MKHFGNWRNYNRVTEESLSDYVPLRFEFDVFLDTQNGNKLAGDIYVL
jgi:hypothetical protein